LPYRLYKDKSDIIAEKLAKSREGYIEGERLDRMVEFIEEEMKLDLKSYDIESTKKILSGVSLSKIVSRMHSEKYQ